MSEDDAYIPCEVCDTMVLFSQYADHVRACAEPPPLVSDAAAAAPSIMPVINLRMQDDQLGRVNIPIPMALLHRMIAERTAAAAAARYPAAAASNTPNDPVEHAVTDQAEAEAEAGEADAEAEAEEDDAEEDGEDADADENTYLPTFRTHLHLQMVHYLNPISIPLEEANNYELNMLLSQAIGNVEVGIQDVDTVSKRQAPGGWAPSDAAAVCPVCQEAFSEKLEAASVRTTLCGHDFCDACLSAWLKKSKRCPVCMVDLEDAAARQHIRI